MFLVLQPKRVPIRWKIIKLILNSSGKLESHDISARCLAKMSNVQLFDTVSPQESHPVKFFEAIFTMRCYLVDVDE